MNKSSREFPTHFLWGASTSAHQVEGGNHNQWSVWELENARTLAAKSSYQYGDLDAWSTVKKQAKNPSNYVSGRAANHYELYASDFDLARRLNMNAFRFSVEWSRVQPALGTWDEAELQHYKRYVAEMKRRGLEPVMTLFHFTLPVWFAEMGGFEKKSNVKYFMAFAEKILDTLGSSIKFIITVNEPEAYAFESYYFGHWPPQVQSKARAVRVFTNLAHAHNKVADLAHAKSRRYKVSVAKNSTFIYPGDDSKLSVRSAALAQYFIDDYFLKKVAKRCDFLGVNYYFSARVYGYRQHNPEQNVSDLGWDMQPANIGRVIERLYEKYHLPIIITENGLADTSDARRKWWLTQTIAAMHQAIQQKIPVMGYLHWSLTDNFEWDKGFWPRFGLYEVDYRTMQRKPRPSAIWLGHVIKKIRGV